MAVGKGGGVMKWPIVDFVFNLIVLSSLIVILIIIWAIIIGMIVMFFEK